MCVKWVLKKKTKYECDMFVHLGGGGWGGVWVGVIIVQFLALVHVRYYRTFCVYFCRPENFRNNYIYSFLDKRGIEEALKERIPSWLTSSWHHPRACCEHVWYPLHKTSSLRCC